MVLNSPLTSQAQNVTGQPFRRLTFVPATKSDSHSAPVGVDLIPLNDPAEVRIAWANGLRKPRHVFVELEVLALINCPCHGGWRLFALALLPSTLPETSTA